MLKIPTVHLLKSVQISSTINEKIEKLKQNEIAKNEYKKNRIKYFELRIIKFLFICRFRKGINTCVIVQLAHHFW